MAEQIVASTAAVPKPPRIRWSPKDFRVGPGLMRCRNCGEGKPFAEFGTEQTTRGIKSVCKNCEKLRNRARYQGSAEVRIKEADRARTVNYGMSAGEFTAMLCAQAGLCAACDAQLGPARKELHIDHCHSTGIIRGLLCRGCNLAAGHVNDSPDRLRLLIAYLEKPESETLSDSS